MIRDGGRCAITGTYDVDWHTIPHDADTGITNGAHVVPFAFASGTENETEQSSIYQLCDIWSSMYRIFPNLRKFGMAQINDPANALTLQAEMHTTFGAFRWALEPHSEAGNKYIFRMFCPNKVPRRYQRVILDGQTITLPPAVECVPGTSIYRIPETSSELLQAHWSIARILHMSGAGENIDQELEKWAASTVLANDGSSVLPDLFFAKLINVF